MVTRRTVFSTLIAAILLIIVLRSLNLGEMLAAIKSVSIVPVIIGISMSLGLVPVMTYRWRILLNDLGKIPSYKVSLIDHWSGMSVGWATPSAIGWDAFRATRMATRMGFPEGQVIIILIEKFSRLLACFIISMIMFPLIYENLDLLKHSNLPSFSYLILIIVLFLFSLIMTWKLGPLFLTYISKYVRKVIAHWTESEIESSISINLSKLLFVKATLISFIPVLLISIGHFIFFHTLNIEIEFLSILFVVAILDIIFSLPISFGSIGVREIGYIMMYGLFDISPETAVLISTLTLVGIVNNSIIGAILARWSLIKDKNGINLDENS